MTDRVVKKSSVFSEAELDEDSSYDSDTEAVASPHQNVSRNVSETLAQELIEEFNSPNYRQYLEFALKLGYSERLVQLALGRLENPTNNELLAALIKLGSQPGSNACDFGADVSGPDASDDNSLFESECFRPIVIDGSNVAMSHGNKDVFSCRGIAICVDWFRQRGHKDITVFVPKWRKESARADNPIKDQEILNELEKERILVYTPSRSLTNGKRISCYDDRYILKLAVDNDGIIVSNDNYRDLLQESNEYRKVVEERILMYSFVNDRFMPPDDPLGKLGPTLDNFLKFQTRKSDLQICPYLQKCTYGNKCKFFHPERGSHPHKSVTEKLSDFANYHLQARNSEAVKKQVQGKSLSVPLTTTLGNNAKLNSYNATVTPPGAESYTRKSLCRTSSHTLNPTSPQQPHPSQQQHQIQHRLSPGQAFSASTSPTNNILPMMQQQPFPKSNSIDNLPVNYGNNLWNQPGDHQHQDPTQNLHKKLQRQLSLFTPFDPRLPVYQGYHNRSVQGRQNLDHHLQSNASSHQTLSNSASGQNLAQSAYEHQHVMRIASAPTPKSTTGPSQPMANNWTNSNTYNYLPSSSASEPHINWPIADQRRRLHYHLCNIFPKHDVEHAMRMFPDEANPQKICSAILNIQSNQQ